MMDRRIVTGEGWKRASQVLGPVSVGKASVPVSLFIRVSENGDAFSDYGPSEMVPHSPDDMVDKGQIKE